MSKKIIIPAISVIILGVAIGLIWQRGQGRGIEAPDLVIPPKEMAGAATHKLAIQPCLNPAETYRKYKSISDYLTAETGEKFEIVILNSEEDFHNAIKEGAFAVQDPFSTYIHNQYIATSIPLAIALSSEGKAEERGAFIVRADSGIKSLSDLQGRSFLFGDKTSGPKYFAAYISLKKAGIDIEKDLKLYEFGGECSEIAMSVFMGEVDAGVVCLEDYIEDGEAEGLFDFEDDLRVIAKTIPVPSKILTAPVEANQEIVTKVRSAIMKLTPGSALAEEVLKDIEWSGFRGASGDEVEKAMGLIETYAIPVPAILL